MIDYWCNAFTPDHRAPWHEVIERDGLSIRLGAREHDDFTTATEMVDRMDRLSITTLVIPFCAATDEPDLDDFARHAARPHEVADLAADHPGRFVGLFSVSPDAGTADVASAESALGEAWCVGLHNHTHSWNRPFDHRDYDPYYQLAAASGVPFIVQAGASGGHHDHHMGHPDAITDPATRYPTIDFVLSHTGAPWVAETIAAARAHPNVVIGTATHPPRRWPAELTDYIVGDGSTKVLFGTGYPLLGHAHALAQLDDLDLDETVAHAVRDGNARRVFTRLPEPSGGR